MVTGGVFWHLLLDRALRASLEIQRLHGNLSRTLGVLAGGYPASHTAYGSLKTLKVLLEAIRTIMVFAAGASTCNVQEHVGYVYYMLSM